jgi:hypothetical protein
VDILGVKRCLSLNAHAQRRGQIYPKLLTEAKRCNTPLFPRPLQWGDNNEGLLLLVARGSPGILKGYPDNLQQGGDQ